MKKFEWAPGWSEVKERVIQPSRCQEGEYRRSPVSKRKGVDAIYCCPKGTHLVKGRRGCFKDGRKKGRPILQALRHKVGPFKKRYPAIWNKLQRARGTQAGVRTVRVG